MEEVLLTLDGRKLAGLGVAALVHLGGVVGVEMGVGVDGCWPGCELKCSLRSW